MKAVTFDTHKAIESLIARGYTKDQAEGVVDVIKEVEFRSEVATKTDINELEKSITNLATQVKVLTQITVGLVVANLANILIAYL